MRYTLSNGTVIDGTPEQVVSTLKQLGVNLNDGTFYLSKSRGLIKISEMTTPHLINAIKKQYRDWIDSIDLKNVNVFRIQAMLLDGPKTNADTTRNLTLLGLVNELSRRRG